LCDKYRSMRKWIFIALPLIRKTPAIGANIAIVVELLIQIADSACPEGAVTARRRSRGSGRSADPRVVPFES
jgi:hypothetical protein